MPKENTENRAEAIKAERAKIAEFFPDLVNRFEVEAIRANNRTDYRLNLKNGEKVVVEITKVSQNIDDKHDLMRLWVKHGYMPEFIPTWWSVEVYHYSTDSDGWEMCFGRFNPQEKNGKIDFDWILPASAKNREKILHEVERRATASIA